MPPPSTCVKRGHASSEVTRAICRVPSTQFSQAPWYTLPVHQCRFRVRSICGSYFLEPLRCKINPIRPYNTRDPSLPTGPRILTWFPSTTPFGLALGADLPWEDEPSPGTLGFSANRFFTYFIATHVSISSSDISSKPCRFTFTDLQNTLLPLSRYKQLNP